MPEKITLMGNASGSWALLGRFDDSPAMRANLDGVCGRLHALTLQRTHFKLVAESGKPLAVLRNGANRFEYLEVHQ